MISVLQVPWYREVQGVKDGYKLFDVLRIESESPCCLLDLGWPVTGQRAALPAPGLTHRKTAGCFIPAHGDHGKGATTLRLPCREEAQATHMENATDRARKRRLVSPQPSESAQLRSQRCESLPCLAHPALRTLIHNNDKLPF